MEFEKELILVKKDNYKKEDILFLNKRLHNK